jgi:hypothetical protein
MAELVERFALTEARASILRGLLELRAGLAEAGLEGFQWVDGSFAEDIERLDSRPPNDVDVVTFAALGGGGGQRALVEAHPALFDRRRVARELRVDHYFFDLDRGLDSDAVRQVTYWYSMWSHRRSAAWKGFVEVPLGTDDRAARLRLDELEQRYFDQLTEDDE